MKLGIFGFGNMGYTLTKGILENNLLSKGDIACNDILSSKRELAEQELGIDFKTMEDLCNFSDLLIIAVKPKDVASLLLKVRDIISDKIILSICAGISVSYIERIIGFNNKVARVMPNMPLLVNEGAICISYTSNFSIEEKAFIFKVLRSVGKVLEVSEDLMDAVTGLSGSGPAYVFLFIEALADGGVKAGLPRAIALNLAGQMILGAAKLFLETGRHPADLKDIVASPAGTTIEGIAILERAGFSGSVIDAVYEGAKKSSLISEQEFKKLDNLL